jgi:hypothetical protein
MQTLSDDPLAVFMRKEKIPLTAMAMAPVTATRLIPVTATRLTAMAAATATRLLMAMAPALSAAVSMPPLGVVGAKKPD